jgi:hypothetical protein
MAKIHSGTLSRISEMIPKIVFLMEIPTNMGDSRRFGFEELVETGLEPVIWDLSPVYYPHMSHFEFSPPPGVPAHLVRSARALGQLVDTLTPEDTIILIGASTESKIWRWRRYLKIVFAGRARITALAFGAIPNVAHEPMIQNWLHQLKLRALALKTNPVLYKDWLSRLWERLLVKSRFLRLLLLPKLELANIWAGTYAEEISPLLLGPQTGVKYIHELDYDQVLRETSRPLEECDYIVFLGFGGQDSGLLKLKNHMQPEQRAAKVSKFFDEIERASGLPVVIASHPRSVHGRFEPFYGGRPVIYHQTAHLVSRARLVLSSNDSTAISFVVSFRRPLLMISSQDFERSQAKVCQMMKRRLGVSNFIAEDEIENFEWPEVDKLLYSEYFDEYVKRPGTPQIPFWRSVAQDIHHENLIRNRP